MSLERPCMFMYLILLLLVIQYFYYKMDNIEIRAI